MKNKIWAAVIGILICAALFLAAYMLTEPNETLRVTEPVESSTRATIYSPYATYVKRETVPPTEAPTDPPTEPPTEAPTEPPTEPTINYIVPEIYPIIDTRECITEPPVLPIPADDAPEEEWIAFFYGLLSSHNSWYNMALCCEYTDTDALNKTDLHLIFNNGVSKLDTELTDEEITYLTENGHDFYKDIYRVPVGKADSVLRIYFGTTLENCLQGEKLARYFDKTESYYLVPWGSTVTMVGGIVGYTKLDNGDYCVQYVKDHRFYELYEVVLRRVGDYFQVVSNVSVPAE